MKKCLLFYLVFFSCVQSQFYAIQSAEGVAPTETATEQLPSYLDPIFRIPLCRIWHRIKDKRESRKKTRPETIELHQLSFAEGTGATPIKGNYFEFAADMPLGALAEATMLGLINLAVAHERVHYAEGDGKTKSYHHAVFKEFRAEVKGLELWRKNRYEFGQILHGLYTVYARKGPEECADIHPKPYETLLCWSLYQLRKEQDPDADLYEFIDGFARYRDCYQLAAQKAVFLGDFTQRYQASWRGRLGCAFDSVRFIPRVLNVSMATISASVGLSCFRLFFSKRFAVVGLIGTYLVARHSRRFTTPLEHRVGTMLGRVFNSRLVWDKDAFNKALRRDAGVVAEIVEAMKKDDSSQELEIESVLQHR